MFCCWLLVEEDDNVADDEDKEEEREEDEDEDGDEEGREEEGAAVVGAEAGGALEVELIVGAMDVNSISKDCVKEDSSRRASFNSNTRGRNSSVVEKSKAWNRQST